MSPLARRRPPARQELFASERPPRLVLRFAVLLSLALGLASALILVVVYHFAISQAEAAATRHANLLASALLQREVTKRDLDGPVTPARRRELDRLFRPQLHASDALGVSLVRDDGLVTYSTDHRAIGTTASSTLASEAASGTIVSTASTAGGFGVDPGPKTLQTYAPVGLGSRGGAALVVQSYAPIHRSARQVQLRVGAVLETLLVVLLLVFVPLLARVTRQIARQIDEIRHRALHDNLTDLPNRTHLLERLAPALHRAEAHGRKLAVLHVDLDRFHEINNTLGHEAGDAFLEETARRLSAEVGRDTLLARLGGDVFAVAIECEAEREATETAEAIRVAIESPLVVDEVQLAATGTVGMAIFPKDGTDAETLLKRAEVAAYAAKDWRIGTLAYSPAVDPHDPEQLELVAELRDAAERRQLRLHYQPKIELATGRLVGLEALAYWEHPTRGLLSPGAFIPIAERTGAIRHVTRGVLVAALEQLRDWDAAGRVTTVAVNLTAIDLLDTTLPRQLRALLRSHKVDPSRLCIELTERTVMASPDRARAVLERIVANGIHVSIDDFGTGHSSLALLRNLPVHEVKIDRSFVSDMAASANDRMIVRAAIQLGHSLGLRVVAEGVETEAVDAALRELGCDFAQGFLYGRPEPADVVGELLASNDLAAA